MTAQASLAPVRFGMTHPAVRARRARDALSAATIALVALAAGLAITTAMPHPDVLLLAGGALGTMLFVYLLTSPRYEVTVTLFVLYLGLLDGPVKDLTVNVFTSGLRDLLIIAIVVGMLMRLAASRRPVTLPPLSRWVIAFVAFALIEAFNPETVSFLKTLGGWRQNLEWVPFFFFGYLLLRSKDRVRNAFILIGWIALANGIAGAIQSRMSPAEIASWGPGYHTLAYGGPGGLTARTYIAEGVARLRPPALGADAGFGGGVGSLALPMLLALLATGGSLRRRLLVALFCAGAVLGVGSSASRTSTVVAVVSVITFGAVAVVGRVQISRALLGFVALMAIVLAIVVALDAYSGSAVFARDQSLTSVQNVEEHGGSGKFEGLDKMPHYLLAGPFGYGLGTAGAVGGFGGGAHTRLEGERITGGSAYELQEKELGGPGVLLFVGLTINALVLAFSGLRRIADPELRTLLAGLIAAFVTLTLDGIFSPTLIVTVGAFPWFACGVIAYWFPRRGVARSTELAPS